MGASNSHLSKFSEGETGQVKYAALSMKGDLHQMEDAFAAVPDLDGTSSTSFFGVYDGHGGAEIALYCSKQLHLELLEQLKYQNNPNDAIRMAFFRMDQLVEQSNWRKQVNPMGCIPCLSNVLWPLNKRLLIMDYVTEGSTACTVLLKGNQIIIGNVGDSHCILSVNGEIRKVTSDVKPKHEGERERIRLAGGKVIDGFWTIRNRRHRDGGLVAVPSHRDGLVDLEDPLDITLPVSRSIGDSVFKQNRSLRPEDQMVTCNPEIIPVEITSEVEFLIIASDGIWKWLTPLKVDWIVRPRLNEGMDLRAICQEVLRHCRQTENMTIILVVFKTPAPETPQPDPDATNDPPRPDADARGVKSASIQGTDTNVEVATDDERQPLFIGLSCCNRAPQPGRLQFLILAFLLWPLAWVRYF